MFFSVVGRVTVMASQNEPAHFKGGDVPYIVDFDLSTLTPISKNARFQRVVS
jgi:hypothetical protein